MHEWHTAFDDSARSTILKIYNILIENRYNVKDYNNSNIFREIKGEITEVNMNCCIRKTIISLKNVFIN